MSIFRRFTMLVVLMSCVALTTAQADRVTIYLSGPIRGGFVDTDKSVQDSIKDIRNRLKKMKELQLVDSREEADINLTVIARGVGSKTWGQRLTYTENYKGAVLESAPIVTNTAWVSTVLEVGRYRKEFIAYRDYSINGRWGWCAGFIANNVKAWAVANRERLR